METTPIPARYLLEDYEVNSLVGRVLTILDTLGLQDKQAKAVKDLVKQEIHKIYNYPVWIADEVMRKLEEKSEGIPRHKVGGLEPITLGSII